MTNVFVSEELYLHIPQIIGLTLKVSKLFLVRLSQYQTTFLMKASPDLIYKNMSIKIA